MELGRWAATEHEKIAELALGSGFDRVIFVGANFSAAVEHLTGGNPTQWVETLPDTGKLKEYLGTASVRDNIILIKGSRSMKLEEAIGLL